MQRNKKREYIVQLSDSEAISLKDFAEDRTGNYNPYEDFKVVAKQVKAHIDANFGDYQHRSLHDPINGTTNE